MHQRSPVVVELVTRINVCTCGKEHLDNGEGGLLVPTMSEGEVQDRPLAAAHRETAKMLLCSLSIDVGTGVDERPNLARVAFLNCFEELLVQLMLLLLMFLTSWLGRLTLRSAAWQKWRGFCASKRRDAFDTSAASER
jgi:hypothetical protein